MHIAVRAAGAQLARPRRILGDALGRTCTVAQLLPAEDEERFMINNNLHTCQQQLQIHLHELKCSIRQAHD
jgi:hypothetical protein